MPQIVFAAAQMLQCYALFSVWHYLKAAGTDTDKLDFIVEHLAGSNSNVSQMYLSIYLA